MIARKRFYLGQTQSQSLNAITNELSSVLRMTRTYYNNNIKIIIYDTEHISEFKLKVLRLYKGYYRYLFLVKVPKMYPSEPLSVEPIIINKAMKATFRSEDFKFIKLKELIDNVIKFCVGNEDTYSEKNLKYPSLSQENIEDNQNLLEILNRTMSQLKTEVLRSPTTYCEDICLHRPQKYSARSRLNIITPKLKFVKRKSTEKLFIYDVKDNLFSFEKLKSFLTLYSIVVPIYHLTLSSVRGFSPRNSYWAIKIDGIMVRDLPSSIANDCPVLDKSIVRRRNQHITCKYPEMSLLEFLFMITQLREATRLINVGQCYESNDLFLIEYIDELMYYAEYFTLPTQPIANSFTESYLLKVPITSEAEIPVMDSQEFLRDQDAINKLLSNGTSYLLNDGLSHSITEVIQYHYREHNTLYDFTLTLDPENKRHFYLFALFDSIMTKAVETPRELLILTDSIYFIKELRYFDKPLATHQTNVDIHPLVLLHKLKVASSLYQLIQQNFNHQTTRQHTSKHIVLSNNYDMTFTNIFSLVSLACHNLINRLQIDYKFNYLKFNEMPVKRLFRQNNDIELLTKVLKLFSSD